MPTINQRWPADLVPETCKFGRTRNDILQISPRTRETNVVALGRPLWTADLGWSIPNGTTLAKLRYWLETLEGYAGSVQIWNFGAPYPAAIGDTSAPAHWSNGATGTVSGAHPAGDTTIDVVGFPTSGLIAEQGQHVQIGRRLYTVTAQVIAAGATVSLPIAPGIISAAVGGETVRFSQAACEMRLADQNFDESASAGTGFVSVSAKFVETVVDYA